MIVTSTMFGEFQTDVEADKALEQRTFNNIQSDKYFIQSMYKVARVCFRRNPLFRFRALMFRIVFG